MPEEGQGGSTDADKQAGVLVENVVGGAEMAGLGKFDFRKIIKESPPPAQEGKVILSSWGGVVLSSWVCLNILQARQHLCMPGATIVCFISACDHNSRR